jgi:hypothetical protein
MNPQLWRVFIGEPPDTVPAHVVVAGVPAVRVGQPWAVAANQSRPERGGVRFANRGSPRGSRAG